MESAPTELDYLLKDERCLLEDIRESELLLAELYSDLKQVRDGIIAERARNPDTKEL